VDKVSWKSASTVDEKMKPNITGYKQTNEQRMKPSKEK
jgi:hypothetical protein